MRRNRTGGIAGPLLLAWAGPAISAVPDGAAVWQSLVSLLFVVGLILALGWLLRGRIGRFGAVGARSLAIRAQLALGARERVVVLRVGDDELLVGVSPAGLRTLHVLPRPLPDEPGPVPGTGAFAQRLRAVLRNEGSGK